MKVAFSFLAIAVSVTAAGLASAQPGEAYPPYTVMPAPAETPMQEGELAAPKNAFELSLGTGYTQGFGNLQSGLGMPSVVRPGVAFDLGLGYRIDPHFAVNWAGEYAELTAERTSSARAFTSGIAAQYHFSPMKKVDPWLEVGAGYRVLIEDATNGPNLITHGFQLGRVRAGLEFRPEETVAFGPMIGADATMFLFQDLPNVATNIPDPTVSTFVFAGVQGRFDVGQTTRSAGVTTASARGATRTE